MECAVVAEYGVEDGRRLALTKPHQAVGVCGVELARRRGAQGYREPAEGDDIGVVGVGQTCDACSERRHDRDNGVPGSWVILGAAEDLVGVATRVGRGGFTEMTCQGATVDLEVPAPARPAGALQCPITKGNVSRAEHPPD